jgi:hypothetical protein
MTRYQQQRLEDLHQDPARKMHEHYTEINGGRCRYRLYRSDHLLIASLSNPSATFTVNVEAPGCEFAFLDYCLAIAYGMLEYAGVSKPDG